jgi:hypothetical protein
MRSWRKLASRQKGPWDFPSMKIPKQGMGSKSTVETSRSVPTAHRSPFPTEKGSRFLEALDKPREEHIPEFQLIPPVLREAVFLFQHLFLFSAV